MEAITINKAGNIVRLEDFYISADEEIGIIPFQYAKTKEQAIEIYRVEESFLTVFQKIVDFDNAVGNELNFHILPQFEVEKYRVDFLIKYNPVPHIEKQVIIECDGHDFHEKTKQQAKMDKKRDRYLQGKGYHVLHFTGSELYKNPLKCANEAFRYLTRHDSMAAHMWGERFE